MSQAKDSARPQPAATAVATSDRPELAKIAKLAVRTLPYLKEARRDVLRLLAAGVISIPIGFVVLAMSQDLMMNRLLRAEPLTPTQASLLFLDPALFVDVEALTLASRHVLRDRLISFAVGGTVIGTPIGLAIAFYFLRLVQRINQSLRVHMMGQVQAMSMRHHSGTRVGDSIYHAYQDSAMVTALMAMLVQPIIPFIRGLFMALFVWLLDWQLTAMLGVTWAAAFFVGRYFGPRLRAEFRAAREENTRLTARIQETLSGIKVVKAFGYEDNEQARFDEASRSAFRAAFRARSLLAMYGIVSFFVTTLAVLAAVCYLAVYANAGLALTAGGALAFTGFSAWNLGAYTFATGRVGRSSNDARRILGMWGQTQDMSVGMERAFSQVDLKPEVQDAEDAKPFPGLSQGVTFDRVSFAYQSDRPVLENVTLEAKAGHITALVGPTGSGKSTLVSLLLRLFDPDEGTVEVDGHDIREFTVDSLRENISIALQENLLFGTSIRENIRYAVPDADDETVRHAATIACADEYITQQPQGYDTPLGERGTKLSTGQRQRLSIARAVIKDTPVLVLDEPTASLDADTELRVLRNLHEWGKGRAILLITHRLSTIREADHIVYLSEGRVQEAGSHEQLMALEDGAYRRFVELEQGSHDAGSAAEADAMTGNAATEVAS